jgi:hypothetical protein
MQMSICFKTKLKVNEGNFVAGERQPLLTYLLALLPSCFVEGPRWNPEGPFGARTTGPLPVSSEQACGSEDAKHDTNRTTSHH